MKFKVQKKSAPLHWHIPPRPTYKRRKRKQTKIIMSNVILDKRLECTTGGSNKFWEVKVADNGQGHKGGYRFNVEIHYGKMLTNGAYSRKNFISAKSCDAFVQSKIQEKLVKGYVEVGANSATTTVVAPPPTRATMNGLKGQVTQYAFSLLSEVPVGVQAEVIVTMIVGGEVLQETVKR